MRIRMLLAAALAALIAILALPGRAKPPPTVARAPWPPHTRPLPASPDAHGRRDAGNAVPESTGQALPSGSCALEALANDLAARFATPQARAESTPSVNESVLDFRSARALARRIPSIADRTEAFAAIRSLAPFAGDESVRATLLEILDHGSTPDREIVPFAFLGTQDAEILSRLVRVFLDRADPPEVRAAVAYVLSGSLDASLEALAVDSRAQVRDVALAAAVDPRADRRLRRESLELLAALPLDPRETNALSAALGLEKETSLRLAFLAAIYRPDPASPDPLPSQVARELEALEMGARPE